MDRPGTSRKDCGGITMTRGRPGPTGGLFEGMLLPTGKYIVLLNPTTTPRFHLAHGVKRAMHLLLCISGGGCLGVKRARHVLLGACIIGGGSLSPRVMASAWFILIASMMMRMKKGPMMTRMRKRMMMTRMTACFLVQFFV